MTSPRQPFREPLRATLKRTGAIAVIGGGLLAAWSGGGLARWPAATVVMLWPALGGHWVELWFLNWLRPRLPASRSVQTAARVVVWFVGGIVLAAGMYATAEALGTAHPTRRPSWWLGGLAFIGIELLVHAVLHWHGKSSFYDDRVDPPQGG